MTPFRASLREPAAVVAAVVWWLLIALPLGVCVGSCVALFLACLEAATRLRMDHPEVLWLLPAMGGCIGWLYWSVGKSVELGHNLVVDEIHSPGGGVPLRMAPLILISTVATHLCGGSAGREGTAIQMGGSLAGGIARLIPWLDRSDVPAILNVKQRDFTRGLRWAGGEPLCSADSVRPFGPCRATSRRSFAAISSAGSSVSASPARSA